MSKINFLMKMLVFFEVECIVWDGLLRSLTLVSGVNCNLQLTNIFTPKEASSVTLLRVAG